MARILNKNIHSPCYDDRVKFFEGIKILFEVWSLKVWNCRVDTICLRKRLYCLGAGLDEGYFVWDWWNNQYLWHLGLLLNQEGSYKGKLSASGKLSPIKQKIYCFLFHQHSHRQLFSRCLFGILQGLWNWKHLTLFMGPHPIWVWYEQ